MVYRLSVLTVRDEKKLKRRRGVMGLSFLYISFRGREASDS